MATATSQSSADPLSHLRNTTPITAPPDHLQIRPRGKSTQGDWDPHSLLDRNTSNSLNPYPPLAKKENQPGCRNCHVPLSP
mmetsp:Transcript_19439/g.40617  ORF Transcript_19439/g.40617 Transcript_19439/m.40617 type:complete len:81 (+) Transcript_19439:264-506(+)